MSLVKKEATKQFRTSRWWSNVSALREDNGISERDLSLRIGKNENYINQATKYGGVINVADALALAQMFGTTVENLAFGSVGLEIRKARLEEELKKIAAELEEVNGEV